MTNFVACVNWLNFVTFNGGQNRGGENLTAQREDWSGIQVCTAEGNGRNNKSSIFKGKR